MPEATVDLNGPSFGLIRKVRFPRQRFHVPAIGNAHLPKSGGDLFFRSGSRLSNLGHSGRRSSIERFHSWNLTGRTKGSKLPLDPAPTPAHGQ